MRPGHVSGERPRASCWGPYRRILFRCSSRAVQPTARNQGLKLTLTVVAYDNGMIEVDGVPMGSVESGWTDAAEVLMTTLNEFHTQVRKRRRSITGRG